MKKQTLVAVAGVIFVLAGMPVTPTVGARAQDVVVIQGGAGAPSASSPSTPPPRMAFEVASVKPNKSGDQRVSIGIQPGGRFNTLNTPLRLLIRNAYQLQDFQIVGGPSWVASDRFDIVAKADGDPQAGPIGGAAGPYQLMMRTLLEERFKLKVHRETRDMPMYALVAAKSDKSLGPRLYPSTADCAAIAAAARARGGPPPTPAPGERPVCGMRIGGGTMAAGGFPLSQLAAALSNMVQRVVVDRTGFTGNFDLEMTWTPDQNQQGPPGGAPAGAPPPAALDGPSIFTALQEQLGLKLDSTRGPVEVLVIDSVEQPTAD